MKATIINTAIDDMISPSFICIDDVLNLYGLVTVFVYFIDKETLASLRKVFLGYFEIK